MWTDKDIKLARSLSDEDTLAFLKKVFVELSPEHREIKGQYATMSDEQYGQAMKVIELKRQDNTNAIALIRKLAKEKKTNLNQPTIAPK